MSNDDWNEIKSRVEGLGLKLKLHIKQEAGELDETELGDTGPTDTGTSDDETGSESDTGGDTGSGGDTRAAVEELGEKLQDAFASFGNAAKDPSVRADVKEIGAMLKSAMVETISDVSSDVGDTIKKAGDRATGSDSEPPPPPPTGSTGSD